MADYNYLVYTLAVFRPSGRPLFRCLGQLGSNRLALFDRVISDSLKRF